MQYGYGQPVMNYQQGNRMMPHQPVFMNHQQGNRMVPRAHQPPPQASPRRVSTAPAADDFLAGSEKAVRREYDPETKRWERFATVVKLERRPFAEGSMRYAYMMKDLTKGEAANEYVAKMSKNPNEARQVYYDDVAMQMEAKRYADKFNKRFGKPVVDFLVAYVAELVERPGKPVIGVEQRIHGNYVKYNNNWDWNDERRNTPQAFSHFTWEESGRKICIVDLQGVGDRWTDPQIHSVDQRGYGKGNMGMRGITAFLNNHRCNAICKALKLPPTRKPAKSLSDGTRLKPLEEAKREAEEEHGSQLTHTQRKAERIKQDFKLPDAPPSKASLLPNRLVVQVGAVRGLVGAVDASVTVMTGTQSGETRVVYGSAEPEWQQRFQMALDSSSASLVAVVFDWSQVSEGAGDPAVIGTASIPFQELDDEAGFDDRAWPLLDYPSNRPSGATITLKILRYRNVPKMAGEAGAPPPAALSDDERSRVLDAMQGIKVMIKEVRQLPVAAGGDDGAPSVLDAPLFAFVQIDNCEARTKGVDVGGGAGGGGVRRNVVWNQKMAFPSTSPTSVMPWRNLLQRGVLFMRKHAHTLARSLAFSHTNTNDTHRSSICKFCQSVGRLWRKKRCRLIRYPSTARYAV